MTKLDEKFNKQFDESVKDVGEIPKDAKKKSVLVGIGAGVVSAGGAAATVAAYGTASTLAPISTVAGAAATNATIAWFGGGALAAGGGGMALGAAVLTGGAAVVAVGAGYGCYKYLSRKK